MSALVANGSITLKSGVNIERINADSVTLSDGSKLFADLLVYAMCYGSMNGWLADLVSPDLTAWSEFGKLESPYIKGFPLISMAKSG